MKKTYDVLEIEKVLDLVNRYILTPVGKDNLYSKTIYNDKKSLFREYSKIDEIRKIYEKFGNFPIYSKLNIEEEIKKLKSGKALLIEVIINLKDELKSTQDLVNYLRKNDINLVFMNQIFVNLKPLNNLYNKIISTFTNDGIILDSASSELAKIRRELKIVDKKIHEMIGFLYNKNKDKMQGESFVIKNGRFVLPISTSLKRSIPGIVQDISDSGQTTFIEPFEVAELENDKAILELKERDEINKILDEFRNNILLDSNQLILNNKIIGEIDYLLSKVKYAKEYGCSIPEISSNQVFKLINAKHPLLDKDVCVPNSFKLGEDKTLMLISGPNAGGKTVALKTISTLIYLSKLAIPLNCEEGSIVGMFGKIFVDIGDEQSIESNLSTFSSHVSNLSVILKSISSRDLVVLDELCNGTDPKEGEALSIAICDYLIAKKTISLISSHYTLLKKYGLENKSVLNASFIFDEKRIKPTFKVLLGISGKSYGFMIANKFGVNEEIISNAKKIYEQNYMSDETRKLELLEEKERAISVKEEQLKKLQNKISLMQSTIDKQKSKLDDREEKLKQQKIESLDKYLDAKYNEINRIYREFLDEKNAKKALDKITRINIENSTPDEIHVNDFVLIKSLEARGQVVDIRKEKVKIITDDGFTINTKIDDLKLVQAPPRVLVNDNNIDEKILNQKIVSSSLNLIGYRVYEALDALANYISEAYSKKMSSVRVIHGFGTGKLRAGIWDYLRSCKYVESFTMGNETNGGSGSTIIKLKND